MAYIRVDQAIPVFDGQPVTFKSPASCTGVEGLKIYYPSGEGTAVATFALADAHGNNVGSIDLFAANVLVKVILDTEKGMAFVQNADTNAYLEGRFTELAGAIPTKTSQLTNDSGFLTTAPVTSVNGKTGAVQLGAGDVGARSDTWMPSASDVGASATGHKHTKSEITDFPTSMTPTAHNQAASTITAGTFAGQVVANATAAATVGTAQVRNISAGTTDLTAGSSALETGALYFVYE